MKNRKYSREYKKGGAFGNPCNYANTCIVLQFISVTPLSAIIRFLEFSASEQKNIGGLTLISLSKIFFPLQRQQQRYLSSGEQTWCIGYTLLSGRVLL